MQYSAILLSNFNPETSLTITAPEEIANFATSDFLVSTEIGTRISFATSSNTGITLDISCATSNSAAPGRVLSPPISIISAPAETIDMQCSVAAFKVEYLPPSEKLSGVTFKIPMIVGVSKDIRQILGLLLVIFSKMWLGIFLANTISDPEFLESFTACVNQKAVPRIICALLGISHSDLIIGRKYSLIFI